MHYYNAFIIIHVMKNIRRVGGTVYYDCQDPNCPKPGKPHAVSRADIMASMYTLLEDMADSNDMRLEEAEVGVRLIWDVLYPESRKGQPEETPMPFEKQYEGLRRQLNVIEFFEMMPKSKRLLKN